ncbi:hypothetical protein PEC106568_19380 [Pectobacterium carotovorum subsp. carotovorum]|nr:hypothetical protein PEC106568_19380 [Pectobacterium carotovorum subsp. carotovorum]
MTDAHHFHTGPAGSGDFKLPYDRLTSERFEDFCLELVVKHLELGKTYSSVIGKMNGGRGTDQRGGDFLVILTDHSSNTFYHLYEIKSGSTLSLEKYKHALERFKKKRASWSQNITEFYIITASTSSVSVNDEVIVQQKELATSGVKHQLYDSGDLRAWMSKVKSPIILTEFFGKEYVERFLGKNALWEIENGGIWRRADDQYWPQHKYFKEEMHGNMYSSVNERIMIRASMPTPESNLISCQITLRNPDYNHLSLTLDQNYLFNQAFAGRETPAESCIRPWIRACKGTFFFCHIGTCSIDLPFQDVAAICDAFDLLWIKYKKLIAQIDELYQSTHFRDEGYSTGGVPMLELPLWLWNRLYFFCEQHDFMQSNEEWSIFSTAANRIMIFNTQQRFVFPGNEVHFRATPAKYENPFHISHVILLWDVPGTFHWPLEDYINPDRYLDVLTTHNWIKDKLLPAAFEWFEDYKISKYNKRDFFLSLIKRKKRESLGQWMIWSKYDPSSIVEISSIHDFDNLEKTIIRLQIFYNSCLDYISFDKKDMLGLLGSLRLYIKRTQFSYIDYVCGCIGCTKMTKDGVLEKIENITQWDLDYKKRNVLIDMVLRSMISCSRDGEINMFMSDVSKVKNNLVPFLNVMNDELLLQRQRTKHRVD